MNMNKNKRLPTLNKAGAESMRAKRRVRIPFATRATRSIRTTRIRRNIGNHGDVENTVVFEPDLIFNPITTKLTEKNFVYAINMPVSL